METQLAVDTEAIPWIPLGPGESFKPLHFFRGDRGRCLLLRLDPGTVVPRHRHQGEVHAYNLTGYRKLDTGEVIGPGGYVYEPPGNVDSWMAIGDEPVIVHIIAYGAMEYLGDNDEVLRRDDAASLRELDRRSRNPTPTVGFSDAEAPIAPSLAPADECLNRVMEGRT